MNLKIALPRLNDLAVDPWNNSVGAGTSGGGGGGGGGGGSVGIRNGGGGTAVASAAAVVAAKLFEGVARCVKYSMC